MGPYSAITSAADLHIIFLELSSRALLVGRIMGNKLMRKDVEDIKKLKSDMASSSASLTVD